MNRQTNHPLVSTMTGCYISRLVIMPRIKTKIIKTKVIIIIIIIIISGTVSQVLIVLFVCSQLRNFRTAHIRTLIRKITVIQYSSLLLPSSLVYACDAANVTTSSPPRTNIPTSSLLLHLHLHLHPLHIDVLGVDFLFVDGFGVIICRTGSRLDVFTAIRRFATV